jgi:DNA-binding Xre family transcriptional regulator
MYGEKDNASTLRDSFGGAPAAADPAYLAATEARRNLRAQLLLRVRSSGLTQTEIASRAGIDPADLSRLINRQRHAPSLVTLGKLAGALGCSVSELLAPPEPPARAMPVSFDPDGAGR